MQFASLTGFAQLHTQNVVHHRLGDENGDRGDRGRLRTHGNVEVFNSYIEEVKRSVPAEKLLVYSVKEGWEPLGEFLEVNIPGNEPFPHLNDRRSFKERVIKMIQEPKQVAR